MLLFLFTTDHWLASSPRWGSSCHCSPRSPPSASGSSPAECRTQGSQTCLVRNPENHWIQFCFPNSFFLVTWHCLSRKPRLLSSIARAKSWADIWPLPPHARVSWRTQSWKIWNINPVSSFLIILPWRLCGSSRAPSVSRVWLPWPYPRAWNIRK